MKKLKNRIRKHFKDPNNPSIEQLSKKDLEYIDEYMKRKSTTKKIYRIESDSDRLDLFQDDDEGITYFRKR